MKLTLVGLAAMPVMFCPCQAQSTQAGQTSAREAGGKPLLLEKNEGEQRMWRPEPGEVDLGGFILKVTPQSNGSQHLVLVTEDMPPGGAISTHKHLEQDEIVLIEKGTIHVHVGDEERDLHAGGMLFIPARTWVNEKHRHRSGQHSSHIFSARVRGSFALRISTCERKTDNHFPSRRKRVRSPGACGLQGPRRGRSQEVKAGASLVVQGARQFGMEA